MSGERRPGLPGNLRRAFRRDRLTGQVAIGLVGVLCVAAVGVGVGVASAKYNLSDIGAWLTASRKGTVVHANGLAGRIDGKANLIAGMRNHRIKIVQDGTNVLLIDLDTGVVSRLDPSQLKVDQSRPFAAGIQVVVGAGAAYTLDSTKGTVQQIDPVNLSAIGQATTLPPPLPQAGIDGKGDLWVPTPQTGQAVPFHAGRQLTPVSVGKPGASLGLSIAAGVPVITNSTEATATIIKPEGTQKVALPSTVTRAGLGGVKVPPVTEGQTVPLLGKDGSLTLLDSGTGRLTSVALKMARHDLGVPQMLGPRVYIPDQTAGSLIVYHTATNQFEQPLPVTGKPGAFEVFVKDGMLWANDPDGETALSVDKNGSVKPIKKYDPAVPGGHRRPLPTQGPAGGGNGNDNNGNGKGNGGNNPGGKNKPRKKDPPPPRNDDPPGPPQGVQAIPGKGTITVTFKRSQRARVAPTGYVLQDELGQGVKGAEPAEVKDNAQDLKFTVRHLACGRPYTYRVMVRYRDPKTRQITDGQFQQAATIEACPQPGEPLNPRASGSDGQITVTFQEPAETTGVKDYVLADAGGSLMSSGVTPATIPPGAQSLRFVVRKLSCDQEYTFKVVTRFKTSGQAARAAPPVHPCQPPGSPTGFTAAGKNHGADLSWQGTGFDVTYKVSGPSGASETRSTSFEATSLTNNTTHGFTVSARNGAGESASIGASANLAYKPQVLRNANNNQTDTIIRPGTSKSGEAGRIKRGDYVDITMICQKRGDSVTEAETGETSVWWNRISWNGTAYLSVTLMTGPREPGGQVYECED